MSEENKAKTQQAQAKSSAESAGWKEAGTMKREITSKAVKFPPQKKK